MTTDADRREKLLTYTAGLALLSAVLAPVRQNWRTTRRDGFPLSYYPMFSARRKRTGVVTHLQGVDDAGRTRLVSYRHAGTGGLNQVRRQINRAVKDGRAQDLATSVAASVARSRSACDLTLTEVRVVSSRHGYDDFFAGRREPERQTTHACAPVERTT